MVAEVGDGADGVVDAGCECGCEVMELARLGRFGGILLAGGGTTPPGASGRIGQMLKEGACVVFVCVRVYVCVSVCVYGRVCVYLAPEVV